MEQISKISGPLDVAAFEDDTDAVGTKVLAEVVQAISKINEMIDGMDSLSEQADGADDDIATESAARVAADAILTSGLGDLSGIVQALDGRLEDNEYAVSLLNAELLAGHIEESNVNSIGEMVKMMEGMRSYESAQKLIQTLDRMAEVAIQDVGRVA